MKEIIPLTGADFVSDLSNRRAHNERIPIPGFPEHFVTEVHIDDSNTSRVILLGQRACGPDTVDCVIASFLTTDTPLELSYLAPGETELRGDTI